MGVIVSMLNGGLGNQMFQYAIGRMLSIKNHCHLWLDIAPLKQKGSHTTRNYEMHNLKIKAKLLESYEQIYKIQHNHLTLLNESGPTFKPEALKTPSNVILNGYWQSEKYFKNIKPILKNDFQIKINPDERTKKFSHLISNANREGSSVMIHVRRGDYVTNINAAKHHGTCDIEYYEKAITVMSNQLGKTQFFLFSDDPDWCVENLGHLAPMHVVSTMNDPSFTHHHEMFLMQKCRHHIIANSTFSWWAAWLSETRESIVVCPERWTLNPNFDTKDITPDRWIHI